MRAVLTLIAGAGGRPAIADAAAAIARLLPASAAPDWLAPAEACDIPFEAAAETAEIAMHPEVRSRLGGAAIDLVVQPAIGRRKRLLVADLEATIIENEMLDELAEILMLGPRVAAITRRAMNGEIDFVRALEARVALLGGADRRVLDHAASRIRLAAGARTLVATMRRDGAVAALVSGGFSVFAERVGRTLGFDHVVANRLELEGDRVAGRVAAPIVTGETKRDTLRLLARGCGLAEEATLAVGDGAVDLPMLAAAGLGVAFHAKPRVAAAAPWRLDHADLTGLLFLQGYRRDEFAA